jgi:hypothetical protein
MLRKNVIMLRHLVRSLLFDAPERRGSALVTEHLPSAEHPSDYQSGCITRASYQVSGRLAVGAARDFGDDQIAFSSSRILLAR